MRLGGWDADLKRLCVEYVILDEFRQKLERQIKAGKPLELLLDDVVMGLEERGKELAKLLANEPIYRDWLYYVHGIGIKHTAVLIAYLDMDKGQSVSALWRFANLDPTHTDGNRRFKGHLFRMALSLMGYRKLIRFTPALVYKKETLPGKSKYARYVEKEYKRAKEEKKDWNDARRAMHAIRKMIKLFLAHFKMAYDWLYKREVYMPYAVKLMQSGQLGDGHAIYIPFVDSINEPDWLMALKAEFEKRGIPVKTSP